MDAQRFAALWAGCDTQNENEAEAVGKFRVARRMVRGEKLRLIDAFELPAIRKALDDQMQPVQQKPNDESALLHEQKKAALLWYIGQMIAIVGGLIAAFTDEWWVCAFNTVGVLGMFWAIKKL